MSAGVVCMTDDNTSYIPIWKIPRVDPGYIYVIENGARLKIGKSKDRFSRVRAAKTWLPDLHLIGVKPFWLVDNCEKSLHEGLAQWWYEGEWFHPGDDPYREEFLDSFGAFFDDPSHRDQNSVNFLYWMGEMAEFAVERAERRQGLRAFQRDLSNVKKRS